MKNILFKSVLIITLTLFAYTGSLYAQNEISETEPNDCYTKANPISPGVWVTGNYSMSDVDWFVITLEEDGNYGIGNSFTYPKLTLYAADDPKAPVFEGFLGYEYLEEGTYFVKAEKSHEAMPDHYQFEIYLDR